MSEATQRNTADALAYYQRNHDHWPFDPDGMCLAICRTARNIAARYPTALSASLNTPESFRVHRIRDIKRGMVAYFDDPNDSNPFGHIVTVVGRPRGADQDALGDLLVWTNSVVSNQIVMVRADFFAKNWGDSFQFAATWLNGEPFYDMQPKEERPVPEKIPEKQPTLPRIDAAIESLQKGIHEMQGAILFHEKQGHDRFVKALKRDVAQSRKIVRELRERRNRRTKGGK